MKHKTFLCVFILFFLLCGASTRGEEECEDVQIEIKGDFKEGGACGLMMVHVPVIRGESCIRNMELYIDNALVGVDPTPPYSFNYDFGNEMKARTIRARAVTFDRKFFEAERITRDYPCAEIIMVQMVTLPLYFLDAKGGEALKIDREKIQIGINDIGAKVDSLEKDDKPLTLGILLDTSRSTKDSLEPVAAEIQKFLEKPGFRDVPVLLMGFHSSAYIACDLTNDREALYKAMGKLLPAGPTSLYDGIYFAVQKMKLLSGRKVLLVFSDGNDKTSRRKKEEVASTVKVSDVTVFHVIFGLSRFQVVQRGYFSNISEFHGGTVFHLKNHKKISQPLDQIAIYLSNRYMLSFYPEAILPSGIWHVLKCKLETDIDYLMPSGFYIQ